MDARTKTQTSHRARAIVPDCCDDDCPSGSRNNYFIGKRLTPDSYLAEQQFLNGRRHLLNRAIHGWGVVYGFPLTSNRRQKDGLGEGALRVGEGLALDRVGRELWQAKAVEMTLDNVIVIGDDGKPVRAEGKLGGRLDMLGVSEKDCWLLTAHYAEQSTDSVTLKGICDCRRKEWDRTCETVIYSLRRVVCEECCTPFVCELDCHCGTGSSRFGNQGADLETIRKDEDAIREQIEALQRDELPDEERIKHLNSELDTRVKERFDAGPSGHSRGGCNCLCEHLTNLAIGADCIRLVDVDGCTRADLDNGVALACIDLGRDECGDWAFGAVRDACGPRRLVKRNDLLFDLINGCDLTRISDIGWASWHRRDTPPVPFEDFLAALGYDPNNPDFDDPEYLEHSTAAFWVTFSRAVLAESLRPDCFAMSIMRDQTEGCWREYYRVPIVRIEKEQAADDPYGHVRKARLVVSADWIRDGVAGAGSIFRRDQCYVEIEIRGDFIVDCLGQTVDANPRGRAPFPTGNGEPGGSYISTFTVAARNTSAPAKANAQQRQRASLAR